ncbi:hypothetical protein LSH36_50g02016 [Paralvinella palmiformis]|uniref:Uncharacterized protein n=1 Tax=Paralvinella palmiformis TaxID=53620 RepID=A0AAD9K7H3_9ANNE|nr:hypothetical protein LSH36_50g02016 [Paralvinella palmiformis]
MTIYLCSKREDDVRRVKVVTDARIQSSSSRRSRRPHLVLFTTMADLPERSLIHRYTIANWAAHSPDVLPILFLPPNSSRHMTSMAQDAIRKGWIILRTPRFLSGLPVLKDMFRIAERKAADNMASFIGYANADILFDANLTPTLLTIQKLRKGFWTNVFVVGRRAEVNVSLLTDQVTCLGCLTQIRNDGTIFFGAGQDYFITVPDQFPWQHIPDFVVGNRAYDNRISVETFQWHYDVIDVSRTLLAVHQIGDRNRFITPGRSHDYHLAAGAELTKGDISHAPWYTEFSGCVTATNGKCQIRLRRRL